MWAHSECADRAFSKVRKNGEIKELCPKCVACLGCNTKWAQVEHWKSCKTCGFALCTSTCLKGKNCAMCSKIATE